MSNSSFASSFAIGGEAQESSAAARSRVGAEGVVEGIFPSESAPGQVGLSAAGPGDAVIAASSDVGGVVVGAGVVGGAPVAGGVGGGSREKRTPRGAKV